MAGASFLEMLFFFLPVCIAFLIGILFGWVWKPRWATLESFSDHEFVPLAPSDDLSPGVNSSIVENKRDRDPASFLSIQNEVCSSSEQKEEELLAVTDEDLKHLCRLVERSDGGPSWKHMMGRSTPNMTYEAWQRDREVGPPQYCSRTVYEDATPELLRDFFWDDEFRLEWDDMLLQASTIEECPTTGTMVVHWVRKFPFFCSNREYIIGRRIWESGRSYYCVTKSTPCSSIPRRDKPRRVDLYYSSWSIKPVATKKGNGELTACEVMLFHHEDMGIPWEIAKFGVRQGMWGAVGKIERGLRAYQKHKATKPPLSRSAYMAQINSKVNPEYLKSVECSSSENSEKYTETMGSGDEKKKGKNSFNIPKLVVFGGVIALACCLDRGLLTKAVIFGVARRLANIGKRL